MTKEDKKTLLVDLSARLPYKVKVCLYEKETCVLLGIDGYEVYLDVDSDSFRIESIKPYLRPMSSMTEEEYEELKSISPYYGFAPFEFIGDWCPNYDMVDWLNAHHFDYRTIYDEDKKKYMSMIEKGLALKAPKGMYK